MKKCCFKTLLVKVTYFTLFAALATLAYSCKKTYTEDETTTPAVVVAAAQTWYQNAYPHSSDSNVINSTDSKADISKFTSPNWKHANTYDRLGSHVVELPLDSTHLINVNTIPGTGGRYNNNSLSRSWFLILNKAGAYIAFVMTVIADSGYVKNDFKKLQHNTYQKRDKDFSGTLLYSTPTGKLIKGWQYKNGNIVHTLSTNTATSNRLNVQSIGGGLKTETIGCTDWYADYYVNDAYILSVYLGTTCADDGSGTPADHNPDGDGGSGSFPPPDAGGGSNSASIPLQIKEDSLKKYFPCATKLIIDSLMKIPGYAALVAPFTTTVKPDIEWQNGPLLWNANSTLTGSNSYLLGTTNSNGRSSKITLNTNMLQNSSQLLIAGTAIHETLHAYLNYLIETNVNFTPPPAFNGTTPWIISLDYWILESGLPPNYRDHYDMLSDYFSKMVSILKTWDNSAHTDQEYRMTMLFGLDTNDFLALPVTSPTSLSTEYNNLLAQYNITPAMLNTFWSQQINATTNKLPGGCP